MYAYDFRFCKDFDDVRDTMKCFGFEETDLYDFEDGTFEGTYEDENKDNTVTIIFGMDEDGDLDILDWKAIEHRWLS